jgi:hypothetical protein
MDAVREQMRYSRDDRFRPCEQRPELAEFHHILDCYDGLADVPSVRGGCLSAISITSFDA